MDRRNSTGRNISGIVIVDKPIGRSSNHVLQQVKRLFNAKKAGHTGSLDPLATGLLPICLGAATKLSPYLLDADKAYHVSCNLGVVTNSGDTDGKVISTANIPEFDQQTLLDLLPAFVGHQQQLPPMLSALKYRGQPLYKLARQGIEVNRKKRWITIYDIQLLAITDHGFTLAVRCSKGTYIRTLVEDISYALGCGGHVATLRRMTVAGYHEQQAVTIKKLLDIAEQGISALDSLLLPMAEALPTWPSIKLSNQHVAALRQGKKVDAGCHFSCGHIKLFSPDDVFIGLGSISAQGIVTPERIFSY